MKRLLAALAVTVSACGTPSLPNYAGSSVGGTGAGGAGGGKGTGGSPVGSGGTPAGATGGANGAGGASGSGGAAAIGTGGMGAGGTGTGTGGRLAGTGGGIGTGGATGSGGATAGTGGRGTGGASPGTGGNSSGVGGRCATESCGTGCATPSLPDYASLVSNPMLPDPFQMVSGSRITSKSQWECRRAEIGAQLQTYELGQKNPITPPSVTGTFASGKITVNVGSNSFTATITLPSTGSAPYPALISISSSALPSLTAMGVALITVDPEVFAKSGSRGTGLFFNVNGADNGAGSLIAWAWGVSRLIDALQVTPTAQIDPTRLAVGGCSRYGRGAVVAGAFDQRIALTIAQESGVGGAGSWRVADFEDGGTNLVETLSLSVGEDVWYSTALNQFATARAAAKLPYDNHELLGMIAPRGLIIFEDSALQFLGVQSTATGATAARSIYQALEVPDNIGFSNSSHTHCSFPAAEQPYLQAFVSKFLLGQTSTSTSVWHITASAYNSTSTTVDLSSWVNWSTPTLN
jgi:hypothetical protein